jgi:hypothetical protein
MKLNILIGVFLFAVLIGAAAAKDIPGTVLIKDQGLMAAQGKQVPFINLFTPEGAIAAMQENARREFKSYEPSEEDMRAALRIFAQGYVGKTIAEGCASITRIVLLSDVQGTITKEAYWSESVVQAWHNNFGAEAHCAALRAKFEMADVEEVRSAAANGEFFVAVFSGSINTKIYKVKRKHQEKLGWLRE